MHTSTIFPHFFHLLDFSGSNYRQKSLLSSNRIIKPELFSLCFSQLFIISSCGSLKSSQPPYNIVLLFCSYHTEPRKPWRDRKKSEDNCFPRLNSTRFCFSIEALFTWCVVTSSGIALSVRSKKSLILIERLEVCPA